MEHLNVLDQPLVPCGDEPLTGFYRDGRCRTGNIDRGRHVVCAIMDEDFLHYSRSRGNDLITPMQQFSFPGLQPGDRWCLCAHRWKEACDAGHAPRVVLAACHRASLEIIELDTLLFHAVDIPRNA